MVNHLEAMSLENEVNHRHHEKNEETRSTKKDIQIGDGDPIRINSFTKIIAEGTNTPNYQAKPEKLSASTLFKARASLEKLPFRIGDKEHIGTIPREVHEALVTIGPREILHDTSEDMVNQRMLSFRFDTKTAHYPISINTHNNLTIQRRTVGQPNNLSKNEFSATVIKFAPDSPFELAGEKIAEICLVIPQLDTT